MIWFAGLLDRFANWYISQADRLLDADVVALRRSGAGRYAWFKRQLEKNKIKYEEVKKGRNTIIVVRVMRTDGRVAFELRFKFKERP